MQSGGEALRLGDPLDLDSDRVYSGLDALQARIDATQLSWRHWSRLEPLGNEPNHWESQNQGDYSRHNPRKDFMNNQIWIGGHLVPCAGM
jgi:hypothetical protein